mgnify:FL=1|jgi:hypothetical protein
MKPKVLVTAGCSYSQLKTRDTSWPVHLSKLLKPEHVGYLGQGAAGNEFISRSVISSVQSALDQGTKPEDILVGIIWSGCDRMHYYSETPETYELATHLPICPDVEGIPKNGADLEHMNQFKNLGKLIPASEEDDFANHGKNPHSSTPITLRDPKNNGHYLLNAHWLDKKTVGFYSQYMNPAYAIMQTCEHILRTQWFLKSLNIKYFMSEYDFDVFTYIGPHENSSHFYRELGREGVSSHIDLKTGGVIDWDDAKRHDLHKKEMNIKYDHPEVNYLYNMIDKNFWLPIENLGDWCKNVSKYDYPREHDPHPGTEQHLDFTNRVILPFLLEKYNIS